MSADVDDADPGPPTSAEASKGVKIRTSTDSAIAIGPTAIMPAVGVLCPSCRQANHPGVAQCVFCGASISAGTTLVAARSGFTEEAIPDSRAELPSLDGELPGAPIADPLIGMIVAERYRIIEPLGRGGMGIVYKVEHTRIGKLLAMKLLTGELSRNPDVVRRFKQEALTVSKLESPNTVQVFDFGATDSVTYLVMELVAGQDLGRVLRAEGPMPFARLCKIVIQVCSSLAEAHQKGIIHRDIKPENIMLLTARDPADGHERTDVAKVLDFGLAKLREGEGLNDVTSQGAIVGTPYFMAPEQIRGDPVDARTDIYALGALMYRAITGHHPFNGSTPMAVFSKHLSEKPIPPAQRAPELGIPAGVNQVVLKALNKNAEERFQRIEDLQAILIDEVRATGNHSVEDLLNSAELRNLTKPAEAGKGPSPAGELATRDEVEAYERKLRRQRYGAVGVMGAIATFLAFIVVRVSLFAYGSQEFRGVEIEPNNTAADAMKLPLGEQVAGTLGKRLDPAHSDRDFYAIDVPASAPDKPGAIRLRVSALPNMPMCTMLYKPGIPSALAQYCVGRPGRELLIPALSIDPGRYLLAVMQDVDPYGSPAAPYVFENVSDAYTLLAESVTPDPGTEIEPNDQVASATTLGLSLPVTATIAWAHDEDVFCVAEGTPGKIRWKVRDGLRDSGVLEVTPMRSQEEGAPVRIHLEPSPKASASDVVNPWQSQFILAEDGVQRCLRVRITKDPWFFDRASVIPNGGSEPYVVEVESVP